MISYDEAYKIVFEAFSKIKFEVETVDILDLLNRVLAEDIISDIDLPPFDNSAMDGIAIKFNGKVKEWKIVGEISAGNYSEYEIDDKNAVYISTGSKLPSSADTVIPVEDIIIDNNTAYLKFDVNISQYQHIRRKADELKRNEVTLKKNTQISASHIAVLASCGISKPKVYKKLKVGILATGDELIELNSQPTEDKIRCSNLYALMSKAEEIGLSPVNLGIVKDDKQLLYMSVESALKENFDILITTGGVSMGKHDFMKDVFSESGVDIKFSKVNIKPGKPLVFGTYSKENINTLVFGMPGNPVSCLVSFLLFIRTPLNQLLDNPKLFTFFAQLLTDIKKTDSKRHFVRGNMELFYDQLNTVEPLGSQSSGNLYGMSQANCLIMIPEKRINPEKHINIECLMI
jgi:molybdopterin molybdotransferase